MFWLMFVLLVLSCTDQSRSASDDELIRALYDNTSDGMFGLLNNLMFKPPTETKRVEPDEVQTKLIPRTGSKIPPDIGLVPYQGLTRAPSDSSIPVSNTEPIPLPISPQEAPHDEPDQVQTNLIPRTGSEIPSDIGLVPDQGLTRAPSDSSIPVSNTEPIPLPISPQEAPHLVANRKRKRKPIYRQDLDDGEEDDDRDGDNESVPQRTTEYDDDYDRYPASNQYSNYPDNSPQQYYRPLRNEKIRDEDSIPIYPVHKRLRRYRRPRHVADAAKVELPTPSIPQAPVVVEPKPAVTNNINISTNIKCDVVNNVINNGVTYRDTVDANSYGHGTSNSDVVSSSPLGNANQDKKITLHGNISTSIVNNVINSVDLNDPRTIHHLNLAKDKNPIYANSHITEHISNNLTTKNRPKINVNQGTKNNIHSNIGNSLVSRQNNLNDATPIQNQHLQTNSFRKNDSHATPTGRNHNLTNQKQEHQVQKSVIN